MLTAGNEVSKYGEVLTAFNRDNCSNPLNGIVELETESEPARGWPSPCCTLNPGSLATPFPER